MASIPKTKDTSLHSPLFTLLDYINFDAISIFQLTKVRATIAPKIEQKSYNSPVFVKAEKNGGVSKTPIPLSDSNHHTPELPPFHSACFLPTKTQTPSLKESETPSHTHKFLSSLYARSKPPILANRAASQCSPTLDIFLSDDF